LARIIKADERATGAVREGEGYNLQDLARAGGMIIRKATERAAAIVADAQVAAREASEKAAQQGASVGRAQGFEQGRSEGMAAGRAEATAEVRQKTQSLAAHLESLVSQIEARKDLVIREAQADLLRLSVRIAEKIVHKCIADDPKIAAVNIREAVELAAEKSKLRLVVNPADVAAAQAVLPELARRFASLSSAQIVPDGGVAPGGCRVLTEGGGVDMEIGKQLARIEQELTGGREGA